MGAKKDAKIDIVNAVVLETGYPKKVVEDVVDSFIGVFQDKICDGTVYIRGFGEMRGVMEKRRYYDINMAQMDESVLPTVKFRPTNSFLNLVKHSQDKGSE
jgi:nucleoid DNA-binding protein